MATPQDHPTPEWTSQNGYRVLLTVDSRGRKRCKSPASVNLDFPQALADMGASGAFDQDTIEVVGYDSSGRPKVYDDSRPADEKHLLPWRIEEYFGVNYVTLSFVMPDEKCTQYAVYFDTLESGLGKPQRYHGLVGDGDWFSETYKRREIGASHMCCFCDFDGDGDLDLFKVTTEPFIYCYENVGDNKMAYRGKLTSAGSVFVLPHGPVNHRSWATITFADWDGDGDQDLFVSFCDTEHYGHVLLYENVTQPGGQITFECRGRVLTQSGKALGDSWFAKVTVVDWDGDGVRDLLICRDDHIEFFRNIGTDDNCSDIRLADGLRIAAAGEEIMGRAMQAECADLDGDGDLDLLVAAQGQTLRYFENIGTRTEPEFAPGVEMASSHRGHTGVAIGDFDGDGLLDYVTSSVWHSRRSIARLFKNVGTPTEPKFEERDASNGCPYTEEFQICYPGRQNTVRVVDWGNNGKHDLLVGMERGSFGLFRNIGNNLFPIFDEPELVLEDPGPGARSYVCDWNNDGKKDLLTTSWEGFVRLYINQGTDDKPVFGEGVKLCVGDEPIHVNMWPSLLVCDWDGDGKKDLIVGMAGEGGPKDYSTWPRLHENAERDRGFLFYKNVGTDAEPMLTYPTWIRFGRAGTELIDYQRPNLGSFVDWDGDGKKDFIACEFEHVVRVSRNIGPAGPNVEPELEPHGVDIVRPWTVMTVSGADAVDWHGDGEYDIATGQGHGGSGLRFYQRDYIEDFVHGTFPAVTVGRTESAGRKD